MLPCGIRHVTLIRSYETTRSPLLPMFNVKLVLQGKRGLNVIFLMASDLVNDIFACLFIKLVAYLELRITINIFVSKIIHCYLNR